MNDDDLFFIEDDYAPSPSFQSNIMSVPAPDLVLEFDSSASSDSDDGGPSGEGEWLLTDGETDDDEEEILLTPPPRSPRLYGDSPAAKSLRGMEALSLVGGESRVGSGWDEEGSSESTLNERETSRAQQSKEVREERDEDDFIPLPISPPSNRCSSATATSSRTLKRSYISSPILPLLRSPSPSPHSSPQKKKVREDSPPLSPLSPPHRVEMGNVRDREPTQAEMDAFFGYVDPYSLPVIMEAGPHEKKTQQESKNEVEGEAGSVAKGGLESAERVGVVLSEKSKEEEKILEVPTQVYQLSPIPKHNSISGLPLQPDERRAEIIAALELLVISVLSQIASSLPPRPNATVLPTPPASQPQPNDSQPKQGQKKVKEKNWKAKPVIVVLAKRVGNGSSVDPTANANADGEEEMPKRIQRILFPRKGKSGSKLPAVLKVIELILQGLRNRVVSTKRDLFYRSVAIFVKQARVDAIVEDIAATLEVRREDLNIVAASKGLFGGSVKVHCTDGVVLEGGYQGALIPPGQTILRVEYDNVEWVLVVEKEAVFHTLCHPSFLRDLPRLGNGILVTGKGYPDIATRELIKRISVDLPSTPLFCLVDSDSHGLEILSTYKFGSTALAFDRDNLAVDSVEWIGVKGSEWDALGVERNELLELTNGDRKKALGLLKRTWWPKEWRRELEFMLHLQRKAEIQILASVPTANDVPLLFKYLSDRINRKKDTIIARVQIDCDAADSSRTNFHIGGESS